MDEGFGPAALAIYSGDIDQLQGLLAADSGLATRTSSVSHPTLLQLVAVEEANIADATGAAAALIEAGAPTHLPVVAAAGCNSQSVLEFLLDRGAPVDGEDPNWSPLDEAIYWVNSDIADLLLARGASIRALSTAAGLGDVSLIERFLPGGVRAADAGPIGSPFSDTIPDALGNDTPSIIDHAFVMAVNCGHRSTAERLISEGANVNATPPGFHWRGTALHAAIWRGHVDLVDWLLAIGADPNIRDGLAHSTALGWAQHHGQTAIATRLTDLG